MNKLVAGAVAGLTLGMLSMASAQVAVSVGGGLQYGYDLVGQGVEADYTFGGSEIKHTIGVPAGYYGLNVFLDATFVQVAVDVGFGGGKYREDYLVDGNPVSGSTSVDNDVFSFTSLGFSLLGKYNIPIREGMEAFPAIGVEYDLCLSTKIKDGYTKETYTYGEYDDDGNRVGKDNSGDFSQFAIKLGVGYDYTINEKVFCRLLALYGLGFPTQFSTDTEKNFAAYYNVSNYNAAFTQNVTVKVSIGYKL
jgi:hypothetical protein